MAHLVDSSVWIALFLDFDTRHADAVRKVHTLSDTLYMPYCVVSEVATVLTYKHSKAQADSFLAFVEQAENIVLLEDKAKEEISYFNSLPDKISFTDAALLFLSQKLNVELVTFDKQLLRISKKRYSK